MCDVDIHLYLKQQRYFFADPFMRRVETQQSAASMMYRREIDSFVY